MINQQPPVSGQNKQQDGSYPANKDEAEKFKLGIIKSLHSDETREQILQQLTNKEVPVFVRLASVASQVINAMVIRVQEQAKRKPQFPMMVAAIKMTVLEVSRMAQMAGVKVLEADIRKSGKLAGDMIEQTHMQQGTPQAGQQQPMQQAPPQQPVMGNQGLLEGAQ